MSPHQEPRGGAPLPPPRSSDLVWIEPFDDALDAELDPVGGDGENRTDDARSDSRRQDLAHLDAIVEALDADLTAVAIVDPSGVVLAASQPFLELVGATDLDEVTPGSAPWGVIRSFLDHLPNELLGRPAGGTWRGDVDHRAGEQARILRTTAVVPPAPDAPGSRQVTLVLRDVTGTRAEVADLRKAASHDPLTGLADRHHILAHLAAAIEQQRESSGHVASIFVDLDHLKYVNDAFGHRAGDRLLASTASRLQQAVRPDDEVARIGGDEFLVVGTNLDDAVAAVELAERIRRALSGHLRIGDLDLEFSVSVGIALTDAELLHLDDDDAASTLVSNADTAMYAAKQAGRGRCVLYTTTMRTDARERTEMAATLARAVADRSLTVQYQPVFSTVRRQAIGVEALVRWDHPRLGRMDPATFVEIAEESGTIGRLGEQVLTSALDDLQRWRLDGIVDDDFTVHVNVSRIQLASGPFVRTVLDLLRARRLAPAQLVLEARETSLLGRATDVDRSIRALRRAGVQVAVDNFGTGPKALAVMTDIGADVLKLDGDLALPAGASETDMRLVRAIVLLAHALEMDVVAEQVGSAEQLDRLLAAGCDMVQGHHLAPPSPAAELDFARRPF